MGSHPQRELSGPSSPSQGTGTIISTENRAIIDTSIRGIEQTDAAPSRAADWGTMASPIGPIVVDSDTPPSLGGLPEPRVRKNPGPGPISPIVDQLDAANHPVGPATPDLHNYLGPINTREAVTLIQQALSGSRQNPTEVDASHAPMSESRVFPSVVEEPPPPPPSGSR